MIVIAIIAILATILVVQWAGARRAAFDTETLTVARNVALAAHIYYAQNNLRFDDMTVETLQAIEGSLVGTQVGLAEPDILDGGTGFSMIVGPHAQGTATVTYDVTQNGVELVTGGE